MGINSGKGQVGNKSNEITAISCWESVKTLFEKARGYKFIVKSNNFVVAVDNDLTKEQIENSMFAKVREILNSTDVKWYDPQYDEVDTIEIEKVGSNTFEIIDYLIGGNFDTYNADIFKNNTQFNWLAIEICTENDTDTKDKLYFVYKNETNIKKIKKSNFVIRFFKSGDAPVIISEESLDGAIYLSNTMKPDLIYCKSEELQEDFFCIVNRSASEFLLDMSNLYETVVESTRSEIIENDLFDEANNIDSFIEYIKEKKSLYRKIVNMKRRGAFEKYKKHLDVVPSVIENYTLDISFDEKTKTINIDNSSIEDVLHLISDDYIIKYLSQEKAISEKTKEL